LKKIKGLSKVVTKKHITHNDFKKVLLKDKIMHHKMLVLRSENHQMYVETMNKKSMTPYDDKRHILKDGIKTMPHCPNDKRDYLQTSLIS